MSYLELFQIILLMSMACVGYNVVIGQFTYHFTNKWPEDFDRMKLNKVLRFILKPTYFCVLCHASVIGTIVFFLFNPIEVGMIKYWIISCFVCAWLNGVLYGAYNRLF